MKTDRERASAFAKKWGLGVGRRDEEMLRELLELIVEVRADQLERAAAPERPRAAVEGLIAAARQVVRGRVPMVSSELFGAGSGSGWKHSRISDSITDRLEAALKAVEEA